MGAPPLCLLVLSLIFPSLLVPHLSSAKSVAYTSSHHVASRKDNHGIRLRLTWEQATTGEDSPDLGGNGPLDEVVRVVPLAICSDLFAVMNTHAEK